jgi:protein involved in polysaccharide export with SLBB domain
MARRRARLGVGTIIGLLAAAASVAAAAPAPPAATGEYLLQQGDVLSVTVLGEPDYSGSFAIRADGGILFRDDMVGAVPVAGLTSAQAAAAVTKRIGEFVKDPSVILSVSRFKVMVFGEVQRPGQYDVDSGARLTEAVARAGGAKGGEGDLDRVYLTRANGEEVPLSLRAFREQGDTTQNPALEPGDRVSVGRDTSEPRGECKVSGAVKRPGSFPLDEDEPLRVSEVVEKAGRWTEEGNPRAALLRRKDGTKVTIDLVQLGGDPSSAANVVMQDEDELFVPRNVTQVSVLGGVRKPGQYHIPAGTALLEAIALAGGPQDNAILSQCVVIRSEPEAERVPADLERLTKKGDMSQNPVLMDRDVVMIPVRVSRGDRKSVMQTIGDTMLRYWWVFRVF